MADQYIWGLYDHGLLKNSEIFPEVVYSIEELDLLWQYANYKEVNTVAEIIDQENKDKKK